MSRSIRAALPPIYGQILPPIFDKPEVKESRATCDTCAMCDHGAGAPVAMDYFRPDAKCCTYHPYLPNYLVGAIFADKTPDLAEGRRRLRAKIKVRIGVTPRWVAPPRKVSVLLDAARKSGLFGRSDALVCPYFDKENGGRCTVWRYRESVCSTYFCKYEEGKPGWQFWQALKAYLSNTESLLSRWSAMAVDKTIVEPHFKRLDLTLEDLEDRPPPPADYASFWGKWVGREEKFYIACYEKVRTLTREDFAATVDKTPDGKKVIDDLVARYEERSNLILPQSLVRNSKMGEHHVKDAVVVTTYNGYDSFSLEKELYEVLGLFSAEESLEQNLARLEKEHGVELAPELLHHLFVHGVLVAPKTAAPADSGMSDNRRDDPK